MYNKGPGSSQEVAAICSAWGELMSPNCMDGEHVNWRGREALQTVGWGAHIEAWDTALRQGESS